MTQEEKTFLRLHNNCAESNSMSIISYIDEFNLWNDIQYQIEEYGWIILLPIRGVFSLHVYILKEYRNQHYGRHLVNLFLPQIEAKEKIQVTTSSPERFKFYNSVFAKPKWSIRNMKKSGKSYIKSNR